MQQKLDEQRSALDVAGGDNRRLRAANDELQRRLTLREAALADLDARHQLYRLLAEQIWNPDRLSQEATS